MFLKIDVLINYQELALLQVKSVLASYSKK